MMEINYTITEEARPTKDILGDHLHYKIDQALQPLQYAPELQLETKITTLLLDQPIRDICTMLADNQVLRKQITAALNSLVKICPQIDRSLLSSFQALVDDSECCDSEDVGTIVYDRVSRTESYLAPKITGMLLELDERTLSSLLSSEQHTLFDLAVQKAKQVLQSSQSNASGCEVESLDSHVKISASPEALDYSGNAASEIATGRSIGELQCTDGNIDNDDDELWRERVGDFVYHEAVQAYPESAAHITGMMLELGPTLLQELVINPSMLRNTIDKCQQAWLYSVNHGNQ